MEIPPGGGPGSSAGIVGGGPACGIPGGPANASAAFDNGVGTYDAPGVAGPGISGLDASAATYPTGVTCAPPEPPWPGPRTCLAGAVRSLSRRPPQRAAR